MSLQTGLPGRLRATLASSTLLFCMGRDRVDGRVTFDNRGLRTEVSRCDDPALFDDIDRAVEAVAVSYGPRRRFTPSAWDGTEHAAHRPSSRRCVDVDSPR